MNLGLWTRGLSALWSSRVQLQGKVLALARESAEHKLVSTARAADVVRGIELQARLAEDLAEATQKILMLEGKIDVIESQVELSATIIASYQAVEETRIAIATADRVRAQAEPRDEAMP